MIRLYLLPLLLLALAAPVLAETKNRFNLAEKPEKPRFEISEKKWPARVGEADICLWHEDKLAALSLGVDDNFGTEIEWWKEQAALYDFKVTWFVISGVVGKHKQTGSWDQFRELHQLGHGVEAHTVTHLHMDEPGWGTPAWDPKAPRVAHPTPVPESEIPQGMEWEYRECIAQIEKNIEGKKVSALAFPGGKNTKYNRRELAAKYFRVARAATARSNPANQIDYLATNAMSTWHFGELQYGWSNVNNILDRSLYRGTQYRGWAVLFAHGVQANPALFARTFEFIKTHREKLWLGLYTDVAKYGQERDTASLRVDPPAAGKITFHLSDEMDDSYFNFPLTVKVRLPDDWKTLQATQSGKPAVSRIVLHENAAYALVQAVPDAGPVTLSQK